MKKQTIKLALAICVLIAVAFTATAVANEDGEQDQYEDKKKTYQQAESKKKASQETVEEVKQKVAERKLQLKKDVCENRKDKLEAKVPRLSKSAVNLKEVFDKIYERVQNFYASGQLTVENYEELKAAVDAAQAEAETAVNAAKDYQLEVDCENPETAQKLGEFRETVKEAKDALKNYRTALVKLISAMKAEAAGDGGEE